MALDRLQGTSDLTATRDTAGYRPNYRVVNDNQATVSPVPPGILNVLIQNNALLPASNKQKNVTTTALPVLSLSATKSSVRLQGRAFTLIQFSFVIDSGDPNFQGVVVWVNGYRGKGTAVNPAWQLLGSGPTSPVVVMAEDTGETIICRVQTFDNTGAYSDFASSPSVSVVLDAANSFEVLGALNLPTTTSTNLWFTGLSSTVIGRMYVGDGTGKQVNFAKRMGSVDTDLFQFFDSGNLKMSGLLNAKNIEGIRFADQYSGSDIGAQINAAITDLQGSGSLGGTIIVPKGSYSFSTPINADGTNSITIQGESVRGTGGSTHMGATFLTYTGTSTPISARSSNSFRLKDIGLLCNNASFATIVVDLSHSGLNLDSTFWEITGCTFDASGGANPSIVINCDHAINGLIEGNYFITCAVAVKGSATAGGYSNIISIKRNEFSNSTGSISTAMIQNPGQAWQIENNDFELGSGAGTPVVIGYANSFTASEGCSFVGNWVGDTGSYGAISLITLNGSGWLVAGNFISGNSSTTALNVASGATGIIIEGNFLNTHSVGVVWGGSNTWSSFRNNSPSSVTTLQSSSPTLGDVDTSSTVVSHYGQNVFNNVLQAANVLEVSGNASLPAATGTNLWIGGNFGSPILGKLYIGDGSGWQLNFAKRTGSADTDLFQFFDSGNLTMSGILTVSGSGVSAFGGAIQLSEIAVPAGAANKDVLWGDSTAHRLKMNNNNGGADTVVGAATTDTFTNKTFDTAGAGNVLKINGNTVSAVTGTGSTIVLATGPTIGSATLNNPVIGTAFDVTGNSGLPAATGTNLWVAGAFGSPILGRVYIGDGTGWQLNFAKRTGSADTDLFQFFDSGNLKMSGLLSQYNGIATVKNGVPSEYATADQTAQNANIGATTLYAVPASGAGMYRVSGYIIVTTAATTSSTLPSIVITWTDADNSTAQSLTLTPTNAGNTLTTVQQALAVINVKASTNIQYSTTGYVSSGATAMQYAVHLRLEAL